MVNDIVTDREAKELKANPWDNMDLLIRYKENFNTPLIILMHDYSFFIEGYSIYLDLLVADPSSGQVQVVEEYGELEAYLNRYRNDKLEGFYFNDTVDEIQSTINITLGNLVKKDGETIMFIEELSSYQFMDKNCEKNVERLRQMLKESGADISKKYFQEKIDNFLKT